MDIVATTNKESASRRILKKFPNGLIFHGKEPTIIINDSDDPCTVKNKMISVFNWYNNTYDYKKSQQWIVDYVRTIKKDKKLCSIISSVNGNYPLTAGWIAKMIINGTSNISDRYINHLEDVIARMENDGLDNRDSHTRKIQNLQKGRITAIKNKENRIKQLTDGYISEIEIQIDNFITSKCRTSFKIQKYLRDCEVTQEQATEISKWFKRGLVELSNVVDGSDEQLVEGYSFLTNKQLDNYTDFMRSIVEESLEYSENAPTTSNKIVKPRKQRKRKIKPPKEQVKKLFYQSCDKDCGLTSVDPQKIVGAEQLWIFNTKYRYLGVYYSDSTSGFKVKGSTIQNFDKTRSIEKKLRKPSDILPKILEGGKVYLRKAMESMRCRERKLTGRINKNTILLKVL